MNLSKSFFYCVVGTFFLSPPKQMPSVFNRCLAVANRKRNVFAPVSAPDHKFVFKMSVPVCLSGTHDRRFAPLQLPNSQYVTLERIARQKITAAIHLADAPSEHHMAEQLVGVE